MIKVKEGHCIIAGKDEDIVVDLCAIYDAIYSSLGKNKFETFIKISLEVFKEDKEEKNLINNFEKELQELLNNLN